MDLGESLVAAYMRHVRCCDVVLTNVHLSSVQGELDVVGVRPDKPQRVWLCEVTTHIRGMNNPASRPARQRVKEKVLRASKFAKDVFPQAEHRFEVWSPRVRPGVLVELQAGIDDLGPHDLHVELITNDAYTARIQKLVEKARDNPSTTGEDAFRLLQILTHVQGKLKL